MITVKELINRLQKFDQEAMCYAYEGEATGIVIVDEEGHSIDFIEAKE